MTSETNTTTTGSEPTSARLVLTLSLAGLLSGLIIVTIFEVTLPTITAYKAQQLRAAVFKVLPGVASMKRLVYRDGELSHSDEELPEEEAVYGGYGADGQLVGYAVPAEGPGFQDTIRLLYGLMPDQRKVTGMEILESRETPGLGDKIYKDADFVGSFLSLAIDPEIRAVKKGRSSTPNELDAITGATISSKAVVRIINRANNQWLPRLAPSSPRGANDAED